MFFTPLNYTNAKNYIKIANNEYTLPYLIYFSLLEYILERFIFYKMTIFYMKRRIIKQGHNTLTITLPAKWIKDKNIKPGQEIDILERGKELIISASSNKQYERKILELKDVNKYLKHYPNNIFLRFIDISYRQGYNELKIIFDDARAMQYIEEGLEFVLGFEIIEQGENYCVIKNIATGLEEELCPVLRRTFLMLISMLNDVYDAISKSEFSRLKNLKGLAKVNNKFTNFCERLLNQKEVPPELYKRTKAVYTMISLLEQIADNCNGICMYLETYKNNEIKISKPTLDYFKGVIDFIKTFYELFYKFDRIKLWELTQDNKHYLEHNESLTLLTTQPKHEIVLLHHLASIMEKAYHLNEALD